MRAVDYLTWSDANARNPEWFLEQLKWSATDGNMENASVIYYGKDIDLSNPEKSPIKTEFLSTHIPWGSAEFSTANDGLIHLKIYHNPLPEKKEKYWTYKFHPQQLSTIAHLLGAIRTIVMMPATEEKINDVDFDKKYKNRLLEKMREGEILKISDLLDGTDFGGLYYLDVPGNYHVELYND